MVRLATTASAVLDLACGTGIVTRRFQKRFPAASFVGVDQTGDYLELYRQTTGCRGILADAETVCLEDRFDLVVSSYLPKYVDARQLVSNILPYMHRGARLILHDFTLPASRPARFLWRKYNRIMNRLGRRFFSEWREVFSGQLTRLIEETCWTGDCTEAMREEGFVNVRQIPLSFGSSAIVTGTCPA